MVTYVSAVVFPCLMLKKVFKPLRARTYSIVNVLPSLTAFLQTSVFTGPRFYEYHNQFFLATGEQLHNLELVRSKDDK